MTVKNIAIPVFGTRVSPRFDQAVKFLLITVNDGNLESQREINTMGLNPWDRIRKLVKYKTNILICTAISGFSARLVATQGIRLIPWITGEINEVVNLYLNNKLTPGTIVCPGGRRLRRRGRWGSCWRNFR